MVLLMGKRANLHHVIKSFRNVSLKILSLKHNEFVPLNTRLKMHIDKN